MICMWIGVGIGIGIGIGIGYTHRYNINTPIPISNFQYQYKFENMIIDTNMECINWIRTNKQKKIDKNNSDYDNKFHTFL